jgi:serine O-acetyltransferase
VSQASRDEIWNRIRAEVADDARDEPALASFLHTNVLSHSRLEDSLSFILAAKLGSETITSLTVRELFRDALDADESIGAAVREDLRAVLSRDPATRGYSQPLLYFKGFHALQSYRVAHYYWKHDRQPLALYLQSRISEVFAVDIHPGAQIGKGIMFDHATSVVIGETAVVEDDFSMLHEVTLGGTGKVGGDRHPKIGKGVMIGAGAKVLGNIRVGEGAKIGAGSVVLEDVAPFTTVAGIPARRVSYPIHGLPAMDIDPDPISKTLQNP